jgi:hypothetical protein
MAGSISYLSPLDGVILASFSSGAFEYSDSAETFYEKVSQS